VPFSSTSHKTYLQLYVYGTTDIKILLKLFFILLVLSVLQPIVPFAYLKRSYSLFHYLKIEISTPEFTYFRVIIRG
jgi:hypothetical protein